MYIDIDNKHKCELKARVQVLPLLPFVVLHVACMFLPYFQEYSDTIYTPASNLGYLAPPRTIFHGCQIVHWDPLGGKRRCPQKKFGLGYVKLHGFYADP